MSSIKDLEMAKAISTMYCINIVKSCFGLCKKYIYTPTGSRIRAVVRVYSPEEGARTEKLLAMPLNKLEAEISEKGKPVTTAVGQYRLEACVSDDHRFCAVQLFRFYDLLYHPVGEPRFFEADAAEIVAKLL
ncbi:MAG: hypothetical protein IJP70_02285 [Bacteroidales bacterium]|nr:hypothetical protein [Bacteroidales bacterium]